MLRCMCKTLRVEGITIKPRLVSPAFANKSLVQQHQLVYGTVNQVMATEELHALALKTYTPEKWAELITPTVL